VTNNPTKRAGLEGFGLEIVQRVPLPVAATPENLQYLQTKRDRMGHDLPGLPVHVLDEELTPRPAVMPGGDTTEPVTPTPPPRPATPLRSGLAGIISGDTPAEDVG
jgi:hypothetical protein